MMGALGIAGLVGGATGEITAGLLDLGIDNAKLQALAEHLSAGKTAMVVELEGERALLARLEADLKDFQAEIVQQ